MGGGGGGLHTAIFVGYYTVNILFQSSESIGRIIAVPIVYHTRYELFCERMHAMT